MLEKTITYAQFIEDLPAALQAAESQAVIVTRHGDPVSVLLSIDNYERLVRGGATLYEAFARSRLSREAAQYDLSDAASETASIETTA